MAQRRHQGWNGSHTDVFKDLEALREEDVQFNKRSPSSLVFRGERERLNPVINGFLLIAPATAFPRVRQAV
jgi:hypothetical protein